MTAQSDDAVDQSSGTEDALLDAAEACFEEWGASKTSMEDVARRAGLSRPTLYRYFSDRDALSVAVVVRRSQRLVTRARTFLADRGDLTEQLVEGLLFLVDHGRRDELVRELLADGRLTGAAEQLTHGGAVARLTREVWGPILVDARRRRELRHDLDLDEAFTWLVQLQVVLIATGGPLDSVDERENVRRMIATFVVPAFREDAARG